MAVSKRNWAAIAVILLWGAALGWLGLRRMGQTDAALISSRAALRLAPGDAWFRVTAGAVQFGYAGITLDTMADGTYRIREQENLDLPSGTGLARAIRSSEYFLSASLGVDSLVSRRTTSSGTEVLRGSAREGGIDLALLQGDSIVTATGRLELDDGAAGRATLVPLRVVPLRLGLVGAIAAGDSRRLTVAGGWPPAAMLTDIATNGDSVAIFADSSEISPVTQRWEPVTWDTLTVRSIRLNPPSGPVRMAVDSRGTVVEIEHLFGARWVREEFSIARFNYRNAMAGVAEGIVAALPTVRPFAGSGATNDTADSRRTWEVSRRDGSAVDGQLLAMLAGTRQLISPSGRLTVFQPAQVRSREYLPPHAEPLAQQGDSAVIALADAVAPLVADRDLERVAARLLARVRVDTAYDAPRSAAHALAAGRGHPDALARLMTAVLARHDVAVRYVIGVMPVGDTLYSHAWAEYAWPGGNWDTVDPLTGRRASAGLIRLARGGSSHPLDLLPTVADVRFSPVNEPAPEGASP